MIKYILTTIGYLLFINIIGFIICKNRRALIFIISLLISIIAYFSYRQFQFHLYILYLNLFIVFFMLSLKDFQNRYILAWHAVVFAIAVIMLRLFLQIPIILNLISVAIAFSLLFIPYSISKQKGLGIGDIIVFSLTAILFTPVEIIIIFMFTAISALLYGVITFYFSKKKQAIPLIPFIALSVYIFIPFKYNILSFIRLEFLYNIQYSIIGK